MFKIKTLYKFNSNRSFLIHYYLQVLCIGLGNPTPTVSLYLDGHLVRSDDKRHLVTTVFNASRVLQKVGCSASNGMVSLIRSIANVLKKFSYKSNDSACIDPCF